MIIVDKPYTSPEMAAYLSEAQVPVLDNAEARDMAKNHRLNLTDPAAFARQVDAGARLYTTSEFALDWVLAQVRDAGIVQGVRVMKDKYRLRETLRPMNPDYFFREADYDALAALDPAALPLPVVLKPAVGFFSVGVHVIPDAGAWRRALVDIAAHRDAWPQDYPQDVVSGGRFILEEYIDGDEYALDAYYDGDGRAVVVNIMKHDFSSASDVGDRLYYTGAAIVRDNLERFRRFLDEANAILGLRDFPFHVELRATPARILPIEFNPLRFAGWCTTDITWFAFGYRTYECFLRDRAPDWEAALAGREDNLYSMIILTKPAGLQPTAKFDYDALCRDFTDVLSLRIIEAAEAPTFGIMFTRTPADRRGELDAIMRSDLREYIRE